MEKIAKDIINVGIGAVESIKKIVDENTSNLQNSFQELAAKGAADQSDSATQLRENLDKAIANIDDLRTKVDGFVTEQQTKLNEALVKVQESLPDIKIDDLKAKVEELTANITGGADSPKEEASA